MFDGIVAVADANAARNEATGNLWATDPSMLRAGGGYVSEGEMFIAREAGPELVGTIGGRTAVANNDQIVAGISAGVFNAVSAALQGNGNGGNKPVNIYLDGRLIAQTTTKYQNQYARAMGS